MKNLKIEVCTSFGVESVTKRELSDLGYGELAAVDGRVAFDGDIADVLRCNVNLRTADRVLVCVGKFECATFDELFDGIFALDWAALTFSDQKLIVTAKSVKSTLSATGAICSVAKKAVVEKLKKQRKTSVVAESGAEMKIEVALKENVATISLDTSGIGLHKRGYRDLVGAAPLKETLAAALIKLSVWNADRPFVDLFCGSGTLPVEAAMIGLDIAPNANRTFAVQGWKMFDNTEMKRVLDEAKSKTKDRPLKISGFDIDENAISLAMRHAERAGVRDKIHFQRQDFKDFSSKNRYGVIISNPPYGERLMTEKSVRKLYADLAQKFFSLKDWSLGILSGYYDFERAFGKRADKNRKLFNGDLECRFFQYLGQKPPAKE